MNTKAEQIASKARRALSKYCYEECKAYCCRRGYLTLDESNIQIVSQGQHYKLIKNQTISILENGKFSLFMGNYDLPCPSLKDNICMIHKNRKRPKACKDFPIVIKDTTAFISSRCPAVADGILYQYIYKLKQLGLEIIYGHIFADFDFRKDFSEKQK